MVSTKLPDIENFSYNVPELEDNIIISAITHAKYFYPEHKTPFLFMANFKNTGKYVVNGKHIEISERCFYFLNQNDSLEINFLHSFPIKILFVLLNANFISDCMSHFNLSPGYLLDNPQLFNKSEVNFPTIPYSFTKSILNKLSTLENSLAFTKEEKDNIIFELLADINEVNKTTINRVNQISAVKKSTKEEIYRRIFLAIEILNDSLTENKSIDEIAAAVQMNKFHFISNFKYLTGTTPYQYYIRLKLQKAFDLLQSSQYSVSEVCYALGFESIGSFSNLFKRRYQKSPSQIPNFR